MKGLFHAGSAGGINVVGPLFLYGFLSVKLFTNLMLDYISNLYTEVEIAF